MSCQRRDRPDRPRREIAAAIRTGAVEPVINAVAAERALEGADHRVGRVRRQIFAATLAAWTQFKHRLFLPLMLQRPDALPPARRCEAVPAGSAVSRFVWFRQS